MAQFNHETADNYGGSLQGGFFGLKNDKDTAFIRYMYNDINEVIGHSVHEVEVNGKKRYVNCIREYNEPIENCPFCAAKYKLFAKLFVKIYNIDTEEVQIWDRGKTYFDVIKGLSARYNPLVSTPFEIERNGKKGDNQTKYMNYPGEFDGVTLEDLPEVPEVLGTLILDKTYDELLYFVETGEFPDSDTAAEEPQERPQRREPAQPQGRQAAGHQAPAGRSVGANPPQGNTPQRRTPANNTPGTPAGRRTGGNGTDRF